MIVAVLFSVALFVVTVSPSIRPALSIVPPFALTVVFAGHH